MKRPTVSRLTPVGRGAIAVIALSDWPQGQLPEFQPVSARWADNLPIDRLVFGRWGSAPGEDVVVCRTSPSEFEIHCHGGEAAVQRILGDVVGWGVRELEPGEPGPQLTGQADPPLSRLAMAALATAATVKVADLLLTQARQTIPAAVTRWLSAEWTPEFRQRVAAELQAGLELVPRIERLQRGWRVVLTGQPNVGKSSLLNALVGYQRAIVTPVAGTTRDVVRTMTAIDGWPLECCDTAGLRATSDVLEQSGIERARATLAEADVVVLVLDRSLPPTEFDRELLAAYPEAVVVANKADQADAWGRDLPAEALVVSAVDGTGVEPLLTRLGTRLARLAPDLGVAWPLTAALQRMWRLAEFAVREGDRGSFAGVWGMSAGGA